METIGEAADRWPSDPDEITPWLRSLYDTINARWEDLGSSRVGESTFQTELRKLSWVPAAKPPWQHAERFDQKLRATGSLFLRSDRHLVGSVEPTSAFPDPAPEAREGMGFLSSPELRVVAAHFQSARQVDVVGLPPRPLTDLRLTVQAVFRDIARAVRKLASPAGFDGAAFGWRYEFDESRWEVGAQRPILLGGTWSTPDCVFLGPVEMPPNRWVMSLEGAWERATVAATEPALKMIGVAEAPTVSDWMRLLAGLADDYEDQPLNAADLELATRAIRRLALAEKSALDIDEVNLLTAAGRLVPGGKCFICDDSRIAPEAHQSVDFVSPEKSVIDVAMRIGVPLVSLSLEECDPDGDEIEPSTEAQAQEIQKYKTLLQLPEFFNGMACIRLHYRPDVLATETLLEDDSREVAELAHRLRFWIYEGLTVALHLPEESVDFGRFPADYFYNVEERAIYLDVEEVEDEMKVALAKAFCPHEPPDKVGKLIGKMARRPDAISDVLERAGVGAVARPDRELSELESGSVDTPEGHGDESVSDGESESNVSEVGSDEGLEDVGGTVGPEDARTSDTSCTGTDTEGANERRSASNSAENPVKGQPDGGAESDDGNDAFDSDASHRGEKGNGGSDEREAETSTSASGGRKRGGPRASSGERRTGSKPSERKRSGASGKGTERRRGNVITRRAPQARLRTYVYRNDQTAKDKAAEERERKSDIGRDGESAVMAYELQQGRSPEQMAHNNPGYDILSTGPDGEKRYIEVKAVDREWGVRGVGVSREQFRTALRLTGRWWLYVVENAGKDDEVIHVIPNPFMEDNIEFRFDDGWKVVIQHLSSGAESAVLDDDASEAAPATSARRGRSGLRSGKKSGERLGRRSYRRSVPPRGVYGTDASLNGPNPGESYRTTTGMNVTIASVEKVGSAYRVKLVGMPNSMIWSPRWKRS